MHDGTSLSRTHSTLPVLSNAETSSFNCSNAPSYRSHPTLDDSFFSIDAFNRETEELEALDVTSGNLGASSDEDALEEDDNDDPEQDDDDDDEMDMEDDDGELAALLSGPSPGGDMWSQAVEAGEGLGTDGTFSPSLKPPDFYTPF